MADDASKGSGRGGGARKVGGSFPCNWAQQCGEVCTSLQRGYDASSIQASAC
jgi:hypothetical protein